MNKNGANQKLIPTVLPQQHKRLLPTTHLRQQQSSSPSPSSKSQQKQQKQKQSKDGSSSEQDEDAVSSPDSASAIDENESVPRGKIKLIFLI